ncbi:MULTISPECIES: Asp23/Gls24 family envelope stress response protein [unclassified Streptomyces]|uniref:Asp23/Gls24 family envelope stress response protein n=2 Tax=Streptomyces TaxID=1883 RepID=A0ABU2RTC5_9ACTN|nr:MULTISPECIES: Asp23/Gls24 family envelope stress response protein [unclassified Streptomyces]MBK3594884.1 Asp23/Gls24 family envelope stress response protein [Streptomyces sp. MBT51]MDT0432082.1 Asp23/Gls24 family envelope stress response protein [Streptomyces sp. DSM 41770]
MTATKGRVAAAERGQTRIADRVVAKIAAQAAKEAVGPSPGDASAPRATVSVHRDTARVHVSLELGYPSDIGRRCGAVRRRVTERVETLAGMDVPEVAVQVERLHAVDTGAGAEGNGR